MFEDRFHIRPGVRLAKPSTYDLFMVVPHTMSAWQTICFYLRQMRGQLRLP